MSLKCGLGNYSALLQSRMLLRFAEEENLNRAVWTASSRPNRTSVWRTKAIPLVRRFPIRNGNARHAPAIRQTVRSRPAELDQPAFQNSPGGSRTLRDQFGHGSV